MDKLIRKLRPPNLKAEKNNKDDKAFSEFISDEIYAKLHANRRFPKVSHIKVFQQPGGQLSGFHSYWNMQCMIKAILGEYPYDTALNLINLTGCANFWKCYEKTTEEILNSDNKHYITDKKKYFLKMKLNPIEPDMLQYLIMFDPLLHKLKSNNKNVKIFMRLLHFKNGMIEMTID